VKKWTRRAFIGTGAVVGGGLVLGVGGVTFAPNRLRYLPEGDQEGENLTTWLRITPDDEVIVVIPHCEMGQGALTGIAMMLAEELDADWDRVRIEEAPADPVYANGYLALGFLEEAGVPLPGFLDRALNFSSFKLAERFNLQTTGGSSSTRATGYHGLRVAGASARVMLLEAAAERFGVSRNSLEVRDSRVLHAGSGQSATFGELADLAATKSIPRNPPLKSRDSYRIVGTSKPRPDIPGKVKGEGVYGIDVVLPGMLYATIRAAPVPGGTLVSVDPEPARSLAGVVEVVQLDNAVAVVAEGYWHASRGMEALQPEWDSAGRGDVDSEELHRRLGERLDEAAPDVSETSGEGWVAAEYRVPYLAHATMEPMCATARIANGRCEVWAGTQDPLNARNVAASTAELEPGVVTLHNLQLGGGFGRRLPGNFDYIEQAVQIARAMSPRPVKLIWSREEDMQHDYYRPVVLARMWSRLDDAGRPQSWVSRFNGSSFGDSRPATPVYSVGRKDVDAVSAPAHLREGAWRSVASSQHGFFLESFVDELAVAAGRDPLSYRLDLLEDHPRHRAVLERVAAMSRWGGSLSEGRARGVAMVESFGSIVAEVAEVSLGSGGQVHVHRVDAAVDCGLVVNPDQAHAQIEGGIIFGLSAALHQEITVRNGAVEQRSFPDFPMVRMAEAPDIHVEFLESNATMGGLGEPGVPPIAPAVANALFALTGERRRTLPLAAEG
jgi:isoquinoline 1-oxidoreductase subunit beta